MRQSILLHQALKMCDPSLWVKIIWFVLFYFFIHTFHENSNASSLIYSIQYYLWQLIKCEYTKFKQMFSAEIKRWKNIMLSLFF